MYEKATGASFSLTTVSDMIMYFYCVVAASDDVDIDFDAFLNWLDDNEVALVEFTKWLAEQNKVDEFTESKKKVRKRVTK